MMMSPPMTRWISITFSGLNKCLDPSICDWNSTPSSRIFRVPGKREDLVSPTVRQDRPIPPIETVQPPRLLQYLQPRPQIQMISISQYDLGADIRCQLLLRHGFHTPGRPDRHEDGSRNLPMIGSDLPRPGRRLRAPAFQFKFNVAIQYPTRTSPSPPARARS